MPDFNQVNRELDDLANDFDRLMPALMAAKATFTPGQVDELYETVKRLRGLTDCVAWLLESPGNGTVEESDLFHDRTDRVMNHWILNKTGRNHPDVSNMQETMAAILHEVLPENEFSHERLQLVKGLCRHVRKSGFSTVIVWSTCFSVWDWKSIEVDVLYAVLGRVNEGIKIRTISLEMHDILHRLSSRPNLNTALYRSFLHCVDTQTQISDIAPWA